MKRRRRGIYACIFISDWLGSTARRELSPAGRAAYWDLLLIQADYGQKGKTCIPAAVVGTDAKIAASIGFTLAEWQKVRDDVLGHFSRTRSGGLKNDRMSSEVAYFNQKVAARKGT